ncbi:MAG: carbohydrate binding family 9 domain-containing protein [Bacteroidales bacterium]|nr:carbohydrate binding family 9 domain-containing protein [Bacteroidales bacterium]
MLLFGILPLHSQEQERRVIGKMTSAIVFDGKANEAAWEQLEPFPMISHMPVFGNPPSEKSVIRMGYDDQFVYVGGFLYVSDPDLVRAVGKKRDMETMSSDFFMLSIDTYNDKENSLLFATNPLGLRWDAAVSKDGTITMDQMPVNMDWNTFWEVKSSYDDQGWYFEMQIPISSLRFQDIDGQTVMGISVFRWIPAKNEGDIFPAISNEWGQTSHLKPSLYEEVVFQELSPKKPLYITPYLLTGFEQQNELNDAETAYEYSEDFKFEPGLDIKYGINPNTVLDLTVNTDFAQVEADDQQFNTSRFSLFFPEKRKFFLERSSIFDFSLGGQNMLFYSRRIGLYEGNPVRIWGGARLNSRINNWDIGLLNLQTASIEDLPSENFGAFRIKKRAFNEYSYLGGMLTTRLGVDGTYNIGYGVDGVVRVFGDDYLTLRWAQTFHDNAENNPISMNPTSITLNWERRKREGLSYSAGLSYSGTDFEPGIGFEMIDDFIATAPSLRYTWISPEASWLQSHNIWLFNYVFFRVPDYLLMIYNLNPTWSFSSKNSWMGSVGPVYRIDQLEENFELSDSVIVPAGRYEYLSGELMLQTPGTSSFYTIFMFAGGGYFDGYKISPSIQPKWNLGASVELGGIYRLDLIRFPDRMQSLNNHIAGLRALYMFSTKLSLSAFVQYNSAINKVLSNIRFRYNPKEGTDLYVVFNEGRNTMLEREVPNLPVYDARNITVKFTYTFEVQR